MNKILFLFCFIFSVMPCLAENYDANSVISELKYQLGNRVNLDDYYIKMRRDKFGLEEYKSKILSIQETAKKTNIKKFFSTVTLNEPVSISTASKILKDYNFNPRLVYVFAKSQNQNEELITIGLFPGKNNNDINLILNKTLGDKKIKILGVVAFIGVIQKNELSNMQIDKNVFLVDISADGNFIDNSKNKKYMQHFGWDIYKNRE